MTPAEQSAAFRGMRGTVPVIPVIVVDAPGDARPLAEALVAGGLNVLEVTLRTEAALQAIWAMSDVPGAVVGAGTVLNGSDMAAAKAAGAKFAVSPGATPGLIDAARTEAMPFLPGAVTSSEVMALRDRGYDFLKFFPAEAAGGLPALKGIGGPIRDVTFCPTGGVGPKNAPDYLALANVGCVGGSWVCPPELVAAHDWDAIEALAREAAKL